MWVQYYCRETPWNVADKEMSMDEAREPDVMPVDRASWRQEINLSNFVNSSYQYRDIQVCQGVKKVLEIGCGQGLSAQVLRWKGYDVMTFDIDETFKPDYIGSVHDMQCFDTGQFDLVICSHVLEHLALPFLDESLREIARVGRYALIYLPVAGTHHFQVRFRPGFHGFDFTFYLDLYNYLETPTGTEHLYCQGQHYWELGYRGFKVKDLAARFSKFFKIIRHYRNRDWNCSYNFVLEAKA